MLNIEHRERYPPNRTDTSKPQPITDTGNLHNEYAELATAIKEAIDQVESDKTWTKKNGRIVSEETKALYEKRTRQLQKDKPTREVRKNGTIR